MRTAKGKGTARSTTKDDLKPVDDRKVGKRKAPADSKRTARKEKRAKKDPNKPKRPPSAFFVFLEEFRQTFKKENPNVKAVSAVGKAGGQKWKSMSQDEKAPYEAKAARKKSEYEKLMNAYNKKQDEASDESERSKSEVNDDEDEASAEEGHEEKGKGKGKGKKPATLEEQEEEDEGEEQGEEDEDEDEEEEEEEEDDGDEDEDD